MNAVCEWRGVCFINSWCVQTSKLSDNAESVGPRDVLVGVGRRRGRASDVRFGTGLRRGAIVRSIAEMGTGLRVWLAGGIRASDRTNGRLCTYGMCST